MEKKSWVCTVFIQLTLCFALYYAINVGEPQTPIYRTGIQRQPNEIYFISVQGGFRPLEQQTRLLKLIEKVINAYKVGFVINISELGEDNPLLQNETQYFHSLKSPWYTTIALKSEGPDYFFKQFNISRGRTLDIIALNIGKIQNSSAGIDEVQLKQLSSKLQLSNSSWQIATGFHPLFCNQSSEQTQTKGNDDLHQLLLKHGVMRSSWPGEAGLGGSLLYIPFAEHCLLYIYDPMVGVVGLGPLYFSPTIKGIHIQLTKIVEVQYLPVQTTIIMNQWPNHNPLTETSQAVASCPNLFTL